MSRKITTEERNTLLENPELVMFNPYRGFKTHRCSLGKALILPLITGILVFLWGILCPEFIEAHPKLFAGVGCAALVIACAALPVLYFILDDRTFKKARSEHYARQLKLLLPEELDCSIAHIQWVIVEKGEGGWIMDGREEMFGFSSYANFFKIEPDTELAVLTDSNGFYAFVKRDAKTESLYN